MPLDSSDSANSFSSDHPTIQTRGHTTPEGILNLSIPVGLPDAEVTVIVHVKPLASSTDHDQNGWPIGYFEEVPGSMPTLQRGPQGNFENRLPLAVRQT